VKVKLDENIPVSLVEALTLLAHDVQRADVVQVLNEFRKVMVRTTPGIDASHPRMRERVKSVTESFRRYPAFAR